MAVGIIEEIVEFSKDFYFSHVDKLADEFDHMVGITVMDERAEFPALSYFVDPEGRWIRILSPDHPKRVMSAFYPLKEFPKFIDSLSNEYYSYAGEYQKKVNPKPFVAIYQSPFKVASYKIEGCERLIRKLILKEKIRGERFISLSKDITPEKLQLIIEYFNRWVKKEKAHVFFFFFLTDIHIVFDMPENYKREDRTIIQELGWKIRKKIVLQHNDHLKESYKMPQIPISKPILTVMKTDVTNIAKFDFFSLHTKMLDIIENTLKNIEKNIEDLEW